MKDHEQQCSNKTSNGIRLEVVFYHLQDVSLPEHVLPNPRAHDECGLMAAEIQTTAVCHVSGNGGQFAKDCWYQANKVSEKGKEGKKDKKGQRKSTKLEEADSKKEGACNNCNVIGRCALNCPKKKESNNASYSGGGDLHCSTYTDDQFQEITRLEKLDRWWNNRTSLSF